MNTNNELIQLLDAGFVSFCSYYSHCSVSAVCSVCIRIKLWADGKSESDNSTHLSVLVSPDPQAAVMMPFPQ